MVRKIWPDALLQYDHFHVTQWLWHYLKNAVIRFRKSLRGDCWALHREELWEMKWGLLKQMNRWTQKEHLLIPEMIQISMGYYTGMRKKEILWLQWDQVDLMEVEIILKSEDAQDHLPGGGIA